MDYTLSLKTHLLYILLLRSIRTDKAPLLVLIGLGQAMVESANSFSALLNQPSNMESQDPPFEETYKTLFDKYSMDAMLNDDTEIVIVEECELPVIDLSRLNGGELEREECKKEIFKASREWGFFQVVNHGISGEILERMRREQVKVFKKPFHEKINDMHLNLSAGSYRWGTPSATCLRQLSWSEAFHVPLTDISGSGGLTSLSSTMKQFATTVSDLAQKLAEILAEKMGHKSTFFKENCLPSTCYLRMNRYPPCPLSSDVFGLMPHTDSDFLTILHQDQIGGLQLVKDGKWIAVKPDQEALIINIGDLFQIDDVERLMEIVKQTAKEGAMLVYTLADPFMAESAKQACKIWGVPSTDILGPITEAIASHLGVSPSGLPRGAPGRNFPLSEEYFRRIEAIEFTIKQDDGALPQNLHKADIILAGVSRTGKTPLSTYLAHKGYKVANVPIVMGVDLPKTLFDVDPEKVFGLTINPVVLQTIRKARAKSLGLREETRDNYSEMDYVKRELEYAGRIFSQNPVWPVIEVTGKAIEETTAVLLRLYHDRHNKCSMPRISKRY